MNYSKTFANISNIEISTFSPRKSGEVAKRSKWIEIPARTAGDERVEQIKALAEKYTRVWVRTTTRGYGRGAGMGHGRIFVQE